MSGRARALVLGVALAVRLVPVLVSDRPVADVLRYLKVAEHVLDVSWNPYQAPRLYPYAPVWVWVEAASLWLSRRLPVSFPALVKLPAVAADLAIVAWLARWAARWGGGPSAAWLYALHPVSIVVTGFHGQFDAAPLAFVLLALSARERSRLDASALCLAAAIALKPFPVLLLPVFLLDLGPGLARRARFAALALLPVAALLLPFALHDPGAVRRELFGYGGVADFGWIGLRRGLVWLSTGRLPRAEAQHWAFLVTVGKGLFLAAWVALLAAMARWRVGSLPGRCLAVLLVFLVTYGALSGQYLLWVVPFAVICPDAYVIAHAAASTAGLVGFYSFLAPGVLTPVEAPLLPVNAAGDLWVGGVGAVLAASLAWLAALFRRPW